jgi:hypothetical protein
MVFTFWARVFKDLEHFLSPGPSRFIMFSKRGPMRILILLTVAFSLSAFAQTRVKENIKQQTAVEEADSQGSKQVSKGKRRR